MKHELLVPVGNFPSLIAAINAGADAVYLGGKKFGARAFADNFSSQELAEATKLCHLYGVKIYVTVNTLVYDNEIDSVLNYVKYLHQIGVDALIMQDVGLIHLVHETFPNLEIHASTQMHNHSAESLKFLEDLGIKRVVFARELSLDYINNINTPLEKEVFIHGSLCISYSGQCLFSSQILNRSGNRGECAGMCRLPYELYEDNQKIATSGSYLLSPKDLCTVNDFAKLMASNVKCFKIEGRMKSPEYVYMVTKIYKNLMEKYENGEEVLVDTQDFETLKAIFNREYTKGFLFNDDDLMNYEAPNHLGIAIGKVTSVTKKQIKIHLTHDLKQFEGIRFKESHKGLTVNFLYDEHNKLINFAPSGSNIYLDNFLNLNSLDTVFLTNPLLTIPKEIIKKIPIELTFKAYPNSKIKLTVSDYENTLTMESTDLVEFAQKAPLTEERIKLSLKKVGNTPFIIDNINVDITDNIFIPIGVINELRRELLEKLKQTREEKKSPYLLKEYKPHYKEITLTPSISVLAKTKEQIKALQELNVENIIVINKNLMDDNFIYRIPRDNLNHEYKYSHLLTTDYASLIKYPHNRGDYFLNITNHYTLDYLSRYAHTLTISTECTLDNLKNLMANYHHNVNVEVYIYGSLELMLMKYCPLKKIINKDKICHVCINNHHYYLKDRNNALYKLENNPLTHSTTILNTHKTDLIDQIPYLKSIGINNYRLELLDETYSETKKLIERVKKYL